MSRSVGQGGFSVFEVPNGDYDRLARLRPIVAERRELLVAGPGDWVTVGDDEEPSIRGRITRRDANKVWVQLELGLVSTDAASRAVGHG